MCTTTPTRSTVGRVFAFTDVGCAHQQTTPMRARPVWLCNKNQSSRSAISPQRCVAVLDAAARRLPRSDALVPVGVCHSGTESRPGQLIYRLRKRTARRARLLVRIVCHVARARARSHASTVRTCDGLAHCRSEQSRAVVVVVRQGCARIKCVTFV